MSQWARYFMVCAGMNTQNQCSLDKNSELVNVGNNRVDEKFWCKF